MKQKSLTYKNFQGTIEYSKKDHVYFRKVIGIDGLISYEGTTLEELAKDFKDAVNDYLEMMD